MEAEAQQQIQPLLGGSERLLWAGCPKRGLLFRRGDVFFIPFTAVWCAGAITFAISVWLGPQSGNPVIFNMVAVFFVLVGLYTLLGRFIYDASLRRRTYYGVSNQRIIILSTLFTRHVKSLNLRTLTDVSMSEGSNGRGTITFGPTAAWAWWWHGDMMPGMGPNVPRFDTIADVKRVYDTLTLAQREAS